MVGDGYGSAKQARRRCTQLRSYTLNTTPDDQITLHRMIEEEGNGPGRRAFYLRLEAAQRQSEQRLIDAKATRDAEHAASGVQPVRGSTLPAGLASTSATVTRGY